MKLFHIWWRGCGDDQTQVQGEDEEYHISAGRKFFAEPCSIRPMLSVRGSPVEAIRNSSDNPCGVFPSNYVRLSVSLTRWSYLPVSGLVGRCGKHSVFLMIWEIRTIVDERILPLGTCHFPVDLEDPMHVR